MATTAYLLFEVIEITGTFYRTLRLGRIGSRESQRPSSPASANVIERNQP
jgi:hypothetical protein